MLSLIDIGEKRALTWQICDQFYFLQNKPTWHCWTLSLLKNSLIVEDIKHLFFTCVYKGPYLKLLHQRLFSNHPNLFGWIEVLLGECNYLDPELGYKLRGCLLYIYYVTHFNYLDLERQELGWFQ